VSQNLKEVFEHARRLVADADRKHAEEEERRVAAERHRLLEGLVAKAEEAFDFTSKEKLELDPRLDVVSGKPAVEFVLRSLRAIFLLIPKDERVWTLEVMAEGEETRILGEFSGGTKDDSAARRLAAARVVSAMADWANDRTDQKGEQPATPLQMPAVQTRWQEEPRAREDSRVKEEPRVREEVKPLTYGTFGKFLGVEM
jgi:hypothetical protein